MTKVDIFSGFLGAGKTTLIKKLIAEAYNGQQLVLIENEFGEIGIDGGFMAGAGIQVNELNSGCICCSLVGDFAVALRQVVEKYHPDRILIEPSGVGKLSDIIRAVADVEGMEVNSATAIADANKCKLYIKNFGEFYDDQIKHAGAIVLSRTGNISQEKLDAALALLRERNPEAVIITTPWDQLDGKQIVEAIERTDTLAKALEELAKEPRDEHHHHHHHHHDHDHDHDEDHDDDDEHEHHHHEHEHEHEHEHDHGHEHHHHHHHHDHDADEVFTSWGVETAKKFSEAELRGILAALEDEAKYGAVLRAKGIVDCADGGGWLHFDHVPGEAEVRRGAAGVTGRLCVIGAELKEDALKELFGV
ncbi:MAG: GTP-binding protein [Oscillospiraceae bacterium]|nr:GTP-binding protein [Oscillospiraceae bacterium]